MLSLFLDTLQYPILW